MVVETTLIKGRAVTPTGIVEDAAITIVDGAIAAVGPRTGEERGAQRDLAGLTVLPGFIDSTSTARAVPTRTRARSARSPPSCRAAASPRSSRPSPPPGVAHHRGPTAIGAAMATPATGAIVLGAHLEGPFLNPARAGAIPPEQMHPAEPARLARLLDAAPGATRLMTVAPDAPGALALIPAIVAAGVVVSLGHTAADYDLFRRAIDAGARHTTHLFNAMTGINHRAPGAAGAALTDERITIELIADGEHIHPAILALAIRAKGIGGRARQRCGRACGPAAGRVRLARTARPLRWHDGALARWHPGGQPRHPRPGAADDHHAAARRRGVDAGGSGADPLGSPGAILGLATKGRITAGYDADLTAIDARGEVRLTIVGGRVVYDAARPEGQSSTAITQRESKNPRTLSRRSPYNQRRAELVVTWREGPAGGG